MAAVDGKTRRRSFERQVDKAALQIVGAWASQNRLILGHVAVDATGMRDRNSALNIAMIGRITLKRLRQNQTDSLSLRRKRLTAGWDNDYRRQLLNF